MVRNDCALCAEIEFTQPVVVVWEGHIPTNVIVGAGKLICSWHADIAIIANSSSQNPGRNRCRKLLTPVSVGRAPHGIRKPRDYSRWPQGAIRMPARPLIVQRK